MPRAKQPLSSEAILSYIFGFVFCGVLAYAELRAEPISDQGFFFLRVLAAISAAGVAAVIPGMLDLQIGTGKLFVARGAGALGVFLLVFTVNPPDLIQRISDAKRTAMLANYNEGLYNDAIRIADEILKDNPNDAHALNLKGGIAFYNEDYPSAVELFARAHRAEPSNAMYISNYANALIEVQAYGRALDLFLKIDDGRRDRAYSLGRAHFYAGNFTESVKYLESVPAKYWHGAWKVIEAASLMALSERETVAVSREEL